MSIWSAARIAALDFLDLWVGTSTTGAIHRQLREFDNPKKKIQSGDSRRTPKIQKQTTGSERGHEGRCRRVVQVLAGKLRTSLP
jgi:hypothetical protein